VLIDCVKGAASVGFMHPLSRERATAFWQQVRYSGRRLLLVAEDAQGVCGPVDSESTREPAASLRSRKDTGASPSMPAGPGAALMRAAEVASREFHACAQEVRVEQTNFSIRITRFPC